MFSAADLIDVVIGRGPVRHWLRAAEPPPPGEFPPSWKAWLAAMGERIGVITGAHAEAIIAIFLQRELATPPRPAGELNRWQSFATLWRQQWQPPEREERRTRLLAIAITVVVHIVLLVILLWLAYVRFTALPSPAGEEVVQVEYIGQGTPQATGGGSPAGETITPAMAAGARAQPVVKVAPTPPQSQPQPQPTPSNPSAATTTVEPLQAPAQPLQVTQIAVPTTDFTLPPPTPLHVDTPKTQLSAPSIQLPTRNVDLNEPSPQLVVIHPQLPPVAIAAPQLNPVLIQREIPTTQPKPQPRDLVVHPTTAPAVQPAATTAVQTPSAGDTPVGTAARSGGPPAVHSGTQPNATAAGSGLASTPKPGALPTPRRGDDWGASTRNRPGGNRSTQPGLFNADGSPRLASGTAAAGGGFPPGSDHWTHDQLDRAGTWLKRPPNDFTATRFEQYWLPSGTLLEEWVRRGIRELAIPIPGTSKKISCVISVLQLGGACGITDPNLNDQEAVARPPPDIPFKPALQEDQGSLRKPGNP